MKKLILILFIFINIPIFAQIANFKNYQQAINKAELYLVENKKQEALHIYFETLKNSKGNFCKDIYNALLLANELNENKMFFKLLNLLKSKGLENDYIVGLEEFKNLHNEKKWKQFLSENQNQVVINKKFRADIDSLYQKDQYFRRFKDAYKIYGDTIKKIDSINMDYIFDLIAKNNFPGEVEIGVSSFLTKNSQLGTQGYDIVFHHYTQTCSINKKLVKITPILVNLVLKGKIRPNKCAHWIEMQGGDFKAGIFDIARFSVNGKKTPFYIPNYSNKQKIIIDEYRKWLCLEPIEDYYKKFMFKINHSETKYIFDIAPNTFEIPDENIVKSITSSMIELK